MRVKLRSTSAACLCIGTLFTLAACAPAEVQDEESEEFLSDAEAAALKETLAMQAAAGGQRHVVPGGHTPDLQKEAAKT